MATSYRSSRVHLTFLTTCKLRMNNSLVSAQYATYIVFVQPTTHSNIQSVIKNRAVLRDLRNNVSSRAVSKGF